MPAEIVNITSFTFSVIVSIIYTISYRATADAKCLNQKLVYSDIDQLNLSDN
jgi:hypothetical protein